MNPLLEAAKQIGEKQSEDDTERPVPVKPGENGVASYERFMSTFGSPARWAGRS